MKKLAMTVLSVFIFGGYSSAQSNEMSLYPTTEGSTLVTRSYDPYNRLEYTTTYRVERFLETTDGPQTEMVFNVADGDGAIVDAGTIQARFEEGDFTFESVSKATHPNIAKMLSYNTQLVDSYLDYPDVFSSAAEPFEMSEAEFMIKDKTKGDFLRVKVYDRQYVKNEKLTTPAGTFDAAKINFKFEVYDSQSKTTMTYKDTEWYALGAGVIRSEVFTHDNQLLGYTVLETLRN